MNMIVFLIVQGMVHILDLLQIKCFQIIMFVNYKSGFVLVKNCREHYSVPGKCNQKVNCGYNCESKVHDNF